MQEPKTMSELVHAEGRPVLQRDRRERDANIGVGLGGNDGVVPDDVCHTKIPPRRLRARELSTRRIRWIRRAIDTEATIVPGASHVMPENHVVVGGLDQL